MCRVANGHCIAASPMLARMSTPAERVWERIRETAAKLAAERSLPSIRHAQAIVAHIIRAEAAELPPHHTVASLAEELLRLVALRKPLKRL
jgi:hypothetical protein